MRVLRKEKVKFDINALNGKPTTIAVYSLIQSEFQLTEIKLCGYQKLIFVKVI